MKIFFKKGQGVVFCFLVWIGSSGAQDYSQIWKHINQNERAAAMNIVEPRILEGSATIDEFLTYYYLKVFDGQEGDIKDFESRIYAHPNPYPYIYALWFGTPVVGSYGLKEPYQLSLLNRLTKENPGNGTLKASAYYQFNHYYTTTRQFQSREKGLEKIGALNNWQFVGPFSNLSGSGFNKEYGPISDASGTGEFISTNGATIHWFTPGISSKEGWVAPRYYIEEPIGNIIFAQTFVYSPKDQDIYLCVGNTGTIKVWINDQLHISVPEERVSEMDTYISHCNLKQGYNRILVQLGSEVVDPNFIIRFTDEHYEPIPELTHTPAIQQYPVIGAEVKQERIPLFAEKFFIEKIEEEPNNLINYLLLNEVYLRNQKVFEARSILEQALLLAPDNSILKFELILCYLKDNNRIGIAALYEDFLQFDQQSLLSYMFRIDEMMNQEKYQDALELIDQQVELYGEDVSTYNDKIEVLANLNMVSELLALVEEAHEKYPYNVRFTMYKYSIEQKVNKNTKQAVKVVEDYLSKYYDYSLSNILIEEYFGQQDISKAYKMLEEQIEVWPYDPTLQLNLLREYAEQQRYREGYALCNRMLAQIPYSGDFNDNKGTIEELMGLKEDAIISYKRALDYKPTLYDVREKLNRLEGVENPLHILTDEEIASRIEATGKTIDTKDLDFYYIQNEKQIILYPEGGHEELYHLGIKLITERGIDEFKEMTLPYKSSSETLDIKEAVLIKPNGKKVWPEINDNFLVWTGIETNDVIYCSYKIRSFQTGKFGNEYYDHFGFESSVPIEQSTYRIILPADRELHYEVLNGVLEPVIREQDEYKIYEWEKKGTLSIPYELYMPMYADIVPTLHVTTVPNWNDIALWYRDAVYSKMAYETDFEVKAVFDKIFKGETNLTVDEKARRIYDYITTNINYSSISFRQSSIIPQRATKTISTRLGDCKDISTLFVSLANLAGIESNLVLVSTRDNGKKDVYLPSFLFNHCIVKYKNEQGEEYFLELTDRNLPFRSLPYTLYKAMSLTIPSLNGKENGTTLVSIDQSNKTANVVRTHYDISFSDLTMDMKMESTKYGALSNEFREDYRSTNKENTFTIVHQRLSSHIDNPITIHDVSFTALDECVDSIRITTQASIKNEVKKIGSLYAFVIPFTDVIFTADPFNTDTRKFDFEYWDYENVDRYETEVDIVLPESKTFAEIPQNRTLTFNGSQYDISFEKLQPNILKVKRKASINRDNINASDFPEFKSWASDIMEIERTYITFK